MQRLLATAIAMTAACRLDPLVEDKPGASANLLPRGASVPDVMTNAELTTQLSLHDGLDDKALVNHTIVRGVGWSNGNEVRFWTFGAATRAPAPLYLFGTRDSSAQFQPFKPDDPQLPLVEAVPGDYRYNPIHSIYHVVVTERYQGELITTTGALADAIELGLVEAPLATGTFVDGPIVRPGLTLEVGASAAPLAPSRLYGHGHVLPWFRLGGDLGVQPSTGLLPIREVSYLREPQAAGYDDRRPIFQATIPTTAAQLTASYTPLSIVIDVDLTAANADAIRRDDQLFRRDQNGAIDATTPGVAHFTVTTTSVVLQLQFTDGQP